MNNTNKYKYVKSTSEPTGPANLSRNFVASTRPNSSFKVDNPAVHHAPTAQPVVKAPVPVVSNPYKLVKNPVEPLVVNRSLTANMNKVNLTTPSHGPFKLTNKAPPTPSYVNTNFKIDKTATPKTAPKLTTAGSFRVHKPAFNARHKKLDINIILGRQPGDLSKNKYKFIRRKSSSSSYPGGAAVRWSSSSTAANPFSLRRFESNRGVLFRPSVYSTIYYQFRKPTRRRLSLQRFASATKVANSAPKTAIVNLSGVKYQISKKGNKLKRLNSKEMTSRPCEPKTSKYKLVNISRPSTSAAPNKISSTTALANNLVYRSIMLVNRNKLVRKNVSSTAAGARSHSSPKQTYCLFFNRFGRCSRGKDCPLVHDPKRVALCPRFLRGTCRVKDCPFSHDAGPEKTPLCSFFAAGHCNRENCPYSHIYLGKDAEFCVDFAKGFCALGTLCNKAHITECPDHARDQKCPRGNLCPLAHRNASLKKSNTKRKRTKSLTGAGKVPKASSKVDVLSKGETEAMDFEASFIAFKSSQQQQQATDTATPSAPSKPAPPPSEPLKLRPSFKKSSN